MLALLDHNVGQNFCFASLCKVINDNNDISLSLCHWECPNEINNLPCEWYGIVNRVVICTKPPKYLVKFLERLDLIAFIY